MIVKFPLQPFPSCQGAAAAKIEKRQHPKNERPKPQRRPPSLKYRAAHVSKPQRHQAEYGRFGGVAISMAGPLNPQQGYVTGTPHPSLVIARQ
jgi:hypothetical protein